MMHKETKGHTLLHTLAIIVFFLSPHTTANTLKALEDSGHLHINSYIEPDRTIVPGQRIALTLEIATTTWFTGGTKIAIPEVDNLIILQTEQFAANATETRDGQTWVIQRWTLDVYPQQSGNFSIQPIAVQVQVNSGDGSNTKGPLFSPPVTFQVAVPEALSRADSWTAAPAFSVTQRFDRDLTTLSVGDAFQQTIVFEAADVRAMMLPDYAAELLSGLAAYPAPPELDNRVNRGQIRAERRIQISYIAEQPGAYILKGRDYFWWDTARQELSLLSIPPTRFTVAGTNLVRKTQPGGTLSVMGIAIGAFVLAFMFVALRLAKSSLTASAWRTVRAAITRAAQQWREWRKPALATRLNPGGSDED
jgi:hypothetical protein